MSITPFTGTISATTLNSNFDDKTSTLALQSTDGQKDQDVFIFLPSMTSSTALFLRTVAFTSPDDMAIQMLMGRATADGTSRTLFVRLTVDNGDTTFLVGNTYSISAAGSVTIDTRTDTVTGDYRSVGGAFSVIRARCLKGVRYRVTMECNDIGATLTDVHALLQLRSIRRAA